MRPADAALSHVSPATSKLRGLSLIEAAIVLGVVGIVIGGIWVAASAAQQTYRANKISEDMVYIRENIQSKGGQRFWRGDSTNTWIGDALQLVPTSYKRHPVATNYDYYETPYFGSGIYVRVQIYSAGAQGSVWLLATSGTLIDAATCIKVISNLLNSMKSRNDNLSGAELNGVQFLSGWGTYTYYPSTATTAISTVSTACRQFGGTTSIRLFFPT